jgi:hypothetical protein
MLRRLVVFLLAVSALAGCASGSSAKLSDEYASDGFKIREVSPRYYDAEQRSVDLGDPSKTLDGGGAVIAKDPATGAPQFHAVSAAQYGLFALAAYDRDGNAEYLRRATGNAQALIDNAEERDGALWFPYPFDFALGGEEANTIRAPWYSGMAQGQALSLFVRMYEHDGDQKWRDAAENTFNSYFVEKRDDGPWFTLVHDGHLWFEEYAGNTDPLLVINGHNFALFGLYDYFQLTHDERAEKFFDGGATTVLDVFDQFRVPGGVSNYCVQEQRCQDADGWPSAKYHMIHIQQLEMLADITGDKRFDKDAQTLRADFYDATIPL